MNRILSALAVSAAVLVAAATAASAQDTIRIGASAPKTGPTAGGAAAVYWPNIQLWVHNVNEAGGIKVGDKKMKVEIVEYDDKGTAEEAVKNIQRLATVDKVDFLVAPYSTGLNLATAELISRYGYPQIVATGNANKLDEFVKRWPNSFWLLGTAADLSTGIVKTMTQLRDEGKIGKKVALVHVSDAFGLEMSGSGKPAFEQAGFEIVYETSYPLGAQDLAPIITAAKKAAPDAFVAYSYPPDSFALTEQAQVQGFNVGVFYVGVGGALAGYGQRFGEAAQGIMAMGGIDPDDPTVVAYRSQHKEITGADADFWASPDMYASLQILQQAIERVGSLDKAAVVKDIQSGTFDTVLGQVKFDKNINHKNWTVGQWKDGVFYGINGIDVVGAEKPFLKPNWK